MKKWIIAAAALALAANAAAFAQSGRNKGSMSDSMSGSRPTIDAPVGHRQPRTADVPDERKLSNPSDPMNKEDAALDRKIKSICRGC